MAITQQSVVLTQPSPGVIQIAVGNETHTLPLPFLIGFYNGAGRDTSLLLFQFAKVLQQAGVNPNTATLAQMKTAIEAQTYLWGA
jgi:hypothetical protein